MWIVIVIVIVIWVFVMLIIAVANHFLKAGAQLYNPGTECQCGHPAGRHEHYREGTDCGACGPEKCPEFRPKVESK